MPSPRKNTSLYFGVLGGNAKRRKDLVRKTERTTSRKEDASWTALMKHSFGHDVLGCPRAGCKARLALVAVASTGGKQAFIRATRAGKRGYTWIGVSPILCNRCPASMRMLRRVAQA